MLQIKDLTYRIGARLLFDQASAIVPAGARVGLVGRNGIGKSTLFKAIEGTLSPESGDISLPAGWRIGAVAQEAPGGPESLIEVVLAADTERAQLLARAEATSDGMERADIEMRLADIESYSAPARAAAILHGLGFDAAAQARPCSSFSGGWRMRVALAAVLFTTPDLLLLDEPTNYLDLEGTLWLYDYLAKYPRTVVVISHDRELLDTCVDHILHVDQGKLVVYRGGYSAFERQRREKQMLASKQQVKQEQQRKHLQAFVDRFRATASKARQAQSRIKMLERLQPVAAIVDDVVKPFDIPAPEKEMAPPLIAMDGVSVGYGDKTILKRLNLSVLPDDRIALLGSNGNGKSTFCKLIAGRLKAMSGDMVMAGKTQVAYFAQHQVDELDVNDTVRAHVARLMPGATEASIRGRAARFGFSGAAADARISTLSGGEKARLMMGLATFGGPHLLILDEPTNHLDIDSRAALVEALNDYPGAIILVSHDRFLIEACAEKLWIVGDGTVRNFDGDMDEYRRFVLSGGEPPKPARKAPDKAAAPAKPADAGLKRKLEGLDAKILRLSEAIRKVDDALANPDVFRTDPAKAAGLTKMRADAAKALETIEQEWLEVAAAMDK